LFKSTFSITSAREVRLLRLPAPVLVSTVAPLLLRMSLQPMKIEIPVKNTFIDFSRLRSDSLDEFVERLNSVSVPFMALRFSPELFGIQLDIPGNGISIQVRGSRLTTAAAQAFDACAPVAALV